MSPKGSKVKFSYGEETRAVSLPDMSFSGLLFTLETLIGQPQHRLSIKYLDEENDLVSVCSEPEFQEALTCFENSSLRLIVELKEVNEQSATNHCLHFPEFQFNTNLSLSEPVELCPVRYELDEEEEKLKTEVLQQLAEVESFWGEPSFTQRGESTENCPQEVEVTEEHKDEQVEEVSAVQENVEEVVEQPSCSIEESRAPVEAKKKRNGKKNRQNKKQYQREKILSKERKRAEDKEKKREAKEKLKKMKDELSEATSISREKAEDLKNALKEDEEKQMELLTQLELLDKSIAQRKQMLRLHKKETKEQLKTLRSRIQAMETEINDSKTKEKETYPVTESADVVQGTVETAEETIDVYQSPKKKSEGKLKLVRFDLNAQDNDFLMNERDREEELEHFEKELSSLALMGFKNVHRNLCLLRKFQGNIERVVDQLIPA